MKVMPQTLQISQIISIAAFQLVIIALVGCVGFVVAGKNHSTTGYTTFDKLRHIALFVLSLMPCIAFYSSLWDMWFVLVGIFVAVLGYAIGSFYNVHSKSHIAAFGLFALFVIAVISQDAIIRHNPKNQQGKEKVSTNVGATPIEIVNTRK
jgi:glucan phosphoethanolaminetransferase (alkaline phosphatase superfamily)